MKTLPKPDSTHLCSGVDRSRASAHIPKNTLSVQLLRRELAFGSREVFQHETHLGLVGVLQARIRVCHGCEDVQWVLFDSDHVMTPSNLPLNSRRRWLLNLISISCSGHGERQTRLDDIAGNAHNTHPVRFIEAEQVITQDHVTERRASGEI